MAVHGFIEFNFENAPQGDRTLVHAVHDGDVNEMIPDLITLPVFLAFQIKNGTSREEDIPEFMKPLKERTYLYSMYSKKYATPSYKKMFDLWTCSFPLYDTRVSLPSYLISKRPDRYVVVNEPFKLYSEGNVVEEADIKMSFTCDKPNDVTISFDCNEDNLKRHLELIKQVNKYVKEKNAKIKILEKGKKIVMNIDKMVVAILFHQLFKNEKDQAITKEVVTHKSKNSKISQFFSNFFDFITNAILR